MGVASCKRCGFVVRTAPYGESDPGLPRIWPRGSTGYCGSCAVMEWMMLQIPVRPMPERDSLKHENVRRFYERNMSDDGLAVTRDDFSWEAIIAEWEKPLSPPEGLAPPPRIDDDATPANNVILFSDLKAKGPRR